MDVLSRVFRKLIQKFFFVILAAWALFFETRAGIWMFFDQGHRCLKDGSVLFDLLRSVDSLESLGTNYSTVLPDFWK
ncbi:hypothetical protein ACM44_07970 [Chryseobacterium koreense CCUG 49689]|uniref:Uncharacterized protein n=1 Tax=Chryseobacterium koreense CCUG 49689 TaxID=1304281 RepID=A0A0J7LQJ3_9FLAO|nr:hypothetical protein ACM44_07970 [Chryseobacterium koreense CCUG 49689]